MKIIKKIVHLMSWALIGLTTLLTLKNLLLTILVLASILIIEKKIIGKLHGKESLASTRNLAAVSRGSYVATSRSDGPSVKAQQSNFSKPEGEVSKKGFLKRLLKKRELKLLKLKRVEELYEVSLSDKYYLPFEDSPCLLAIDGLSVVCLGAIAISEVNGFSGSLDVLLSTAMKLKVDFTCSLVCSSMGSDAEPFWKVGILILLRSKKRLVKLDGAKAQELVQEFVSKLKTFETVVSTCFDKARVDVLLGRDVVKALRFMEVGLG